MELGCACTALLHFVLIRHCEEYASGQSASVLQTRLARYLHLFHMQRANPLTLAGAQEEVFFSNSLSAFFATLQMLWTKTLPRKPITTQSTPLPRRHLVLGLLGTAEQTSPAGGNETGLLTGGSLAVDGRGLTDMLVVTTTVGVIHGVHGNTTSLGPGVALDGELVLRAASLCGNLLVHVPFPCFLRIFRSSSTYSGGACRYVHHQQRYRSCHGRSS